MKFVLPKNLSIEDITRCQDHLLEMARAVTNLLTENKIKYFVGYGSLLGAVRLKNFFPWDDDFDICILDDQYDLAIDLLATQLPERFFLHCKKSDKFYFHSWARVRDTSVRVVPDISTSNIDNYMYSYPFLSMDVYKITVLPSNDCSEFLLKENIHFWKRKMDRNMLTQNDFDKLVEAASSKYNTSSIREIIQKPHIMHEVKMRYPIALDTIFPLKKISFRGHVFDGPRDPAPLLKSSYGNFRRLPPLAKRKPHYVRAIFYDQ